MTRVCLITTGGTIAEASEGRPPGRRHVPGRVLLDRIARRLPPGLDVRVCDLFDVPSTELGLRDMLEISRTAAETSRGVAGVVVSHGTATLEETAYLTDLLTDPTRPIVFTGAMRPFAHPESDGPENLSDAITVAAASTHGVGTVVVFAGAVYAAADVTKVHTSNTDAFGSPDFGPLARLVQGRPQWERIPAHRPPALGITRMLPRVETVTCYSGMTEFAIDAAGSVRVDGLVVEGFGGGEVPPAIAAALKRLCETGIAVAVTTSVAAGPLASVPRRVAWYRSPLRAKKLRIRLWAGLAAGLTGEALREYVEEPSENRGEGDG